ncbi:hypothetical protein DCC25_05840 [Auritidibacter sp. NML120636]|nr:hypothetical protein DCC25_05840 [Auritidibacter sp. NML120636]
MWAAVGGSDDELVEVAESRMNADFVTWDLPLQSVVPISLTTLILPKDESGDRLLSGHASQTDLEEVDAVMELPNGEWSGIEVELGAFASDLVIESSPSMATKIKHDRHDAQATQVVGIGKSYGYMRPDSIFIVSITAPGELSVAGVGASFDEPSVRSTLSSPTTSFRLDRVTFRICGLLVLVLGWD